MRIETERLIITEFTPDMASDVFENSHDEDTTKYHRMKWKASPEK